MPHFKGVANDDTRLADIQANILVHHGRRFAKHIFFRINKPGDFKHFLGWFCKNCLTTAQEQLAARQQFRAAQIDGGLLGGIYFTKYGYDALSIDLALRPQDGAFQQSMFNRDVLSADETPGAWEWRKYFDSVESMKAGVHGMILLACMDEGSLAAQVKQVSTMLGDGGEVVFSENGRVLRNDSGEGIEHFGYVDGVSQPLFMESDIQNLPPDSQLEWDPSADPFEELLLVPDLGGEAGKSFGSYLVFRKLEQNVSAFKSQEEKIGELLHLGEEAEIVGAYAVGRFENGTPVLLNNKEEENGHQLNNFNYKDDQEGSRCPFFAHIRKSNPRDKNARKHLLARRGIPYNDVGRGYKDPERDVVDEDDKPEKGVGLLFMAFVKDIAEQFEHVQAAMSDSSNFPVPNTGTDPIIGRHPSRETRTYQAWPLVYGSPSKVPLDFHGFVKLQGGAYFFAPAPSVLKQWSQQV